METLRECCPRNQKQSELSCIYLMRNRKDPEIHTEPSIVSEPDPHTQSGSETKPSIELLFCGVAESSPVITDTGELEWFRG